VTGLVLALSGLTLGLWLAVLLRRHVEPEEVTCRDHLVEEEVERRLYELTIEAVSAMLDAAAAEEQRWEDHASTWRARPFAPSHFDTEPDAQ